MEIRRTPLSEITSPELRFPIPARVIYAGGSSRRQAFLGHSFPQSHLMSVDINPEPTTCNVNEVMQYKLQTAVNKVDLYEGDLIVAADTRTKIATVNPITGCIEKVSKGKPQTIEEIKSNFVEMLNASQNTNESVGYTVDTASGSLYIDGRPHFMDTHDLSLVDLKRERLVWVSSDAGFQEYLTIANELYQSASYAKYNVGKISLSDISGGISLPVLEMMGAIASINGVSSDSRLYPLVFQQMLHTVAVSIDLGLLEPFGVKTHMVLDSWDWLTGVTKTAMRK